MNISEIKTLEETKTYLEKIMLQLDPSNREYHGHYLAGVIDTLCEKGDITENIRGECYPIYCF